MREYLESPRVQAAIVAFFAAGKPVAAICHGTLVALQTEVTAALARPDDFVTGPLPLRRDGPDDLAPGFVVRDGAWLSARWPGDAHRFAAAFVALLGADT